MERENVRQIPTEELVLAMMLSWVSKNRHFWAYPELTRRFTAGSVVSVFAASIFLLNSSTAASREMMRGFK